MARRGRPTVEIKLSGNERKTLERWARRHSSAQSLALRCRIVLACDEGRTNEDIAAELGIHPVTVSKWRKRFAADRLPGGEPCAGEPHAWFGKGELGRLTPRRHGPHAPEGKPPGLSPSSAPATPNQFPTSPVQEHTDLRRPES